MLILSIIYFNLDSW